jgi:predicted exporter
VRIAPNQAIAIWILAILVSVVLIARTGLSTDMSAFLPRSPAPMQQVLVGQVREGVVSRLVLLAIEKAQSTTLAELSRDLGARLRRDPQFVLVDNGDDAGLYKDREFLWHNRYVLSPGVAPERFTAAGLRRELENDLRLRWLRPCSSSSAVSQAIRPARSSPSSRDGGRRATGDA